MSQLPTGWANTTLGTVCGNGQYGWTCKAAHTGEVRFLRTTDITKGCINWASVPFCDEPPANISKYELQSGDIVISRAGSVGFSKLLHTVPENAVFASYLIRFKPSIEVDPRYVFAYLNSGEYWTAIGAAASGIALANVNASKLAALKFPLAPLPEQKRIADKLDTVLARVDACRDRLDRLPALLKRFRQSILAAATSGRLTEDWRDQFGLGEETWNYSTIGNLVAIKNGRAFPSADYTNTGIRLIRPGNLHQSGCVQWHEKNTIHLPEKYAQAFPGFVLGEGELLMNLTAQSLKDDFLGRVCLKKDFNPALLNQRICAFYPKSSFDIRPYLFVYFRSPSFRAYVDTLDSGTLIKHMHTKQLLDHVIPVPSPAEQHEIVRRVETLFAFADRLESRLATARRQVGQLPPALLAKAFRGELVPQDPADEPASELLKRLAAQRETAAPAKRGHRKVRTNGPG